MPAPRLIASLAVAALALPVAACGEADKGMLSNNQAEELLAQVDLAEKSLAAGGCQTVIRRAEDAIKLAQEQNGVSTELRNNIIEGFQRVADRAETDCEPEEDEPKETPTPEETPTEVPTEEPTPEPTVEPTPEPTEEPTPEPTPEPTVEIPTPEPTEDDTGSVLAPDQE